MSSESSVQNCLTSKPELGRNPPSHISRPRQNRERIKTSRLGGTRPAFTPEFLSPPPSISNARAHSFAEHPSLQRCREVGGGVGAFLPPPRCAHLNVFPPEKGPRTLLHPLQPGRWKTEKRFRVTRCCNCFLATCNSVNGMQALESLVLRRLKLARFAIQHSLYPSHSLPGCRVQYELPEWIVCQPRQFLFGHSSPNRRHGHGPGPSP